MLFFKKKNLQETVRFHHAPFFFFLLFYFILFCQNILQKHSCQHLIDFMVVIRCCAGLFFFKKKKKQWIFQCICWFGVSDGRNLAISFSGFFSLIESIDFLKSLVDDFHLFLWVFDTDTILLDISYCHPYNSPVVLICTQFFFTIHMRKGI